MLEAFLPQEKWILLGIPVLFLVGSLFHYLYELSGKHPLVSLIAPVNESVWEHTKMVVLPVILWWSLFYLVKGQSLSISINPWFTGLLVSLIISIILIPALYYFYTEAFGVSLLWVDILILLIALGLGQLLGLHVVRYSAGMDAKEVMAILAGILLFYAVVTLRPPKLPLFRSS
jgi:hypothetical protein